MRLIDPKMSIDTIKSYIEVWDCKGCLPDGGTQHNVMAVDDLPYLPTIEAEPVRNGRWIECDYKHMEHGMIETEPKAGLCCTECRTGFKKKNMTYKQYCPACGARMDADHIADVSKKVGGADNGFD